MSVVGLGGCGTSCCCWVEADSGGSGSRPSAAAILSMWSTLVMASAAPPMRNIGSPSFAHVSSPAAPV